MKAELAQAPIDASEEPVEPELDRLVTTRKITTTSLGGVKICAYFCVPQIPGAGPLPAVVYTPGYGGDTSWTTVAGIAYDQGYCVLTLYPRGQGPSKHHWQVPEGLTKLTMGLDAPSNHYYRMGYADCLRGIDFLCSRDEVDSSRIGVIGLSQGGGLTLATAALDDRVRVAISHEPFLSNYPVSVETATTGPYLELTKHFSANPQLKQASLDTLAWIDPLNLAPWISCPTMVSVGQIDTTCPPETIRPIYDRIPALKSLVEFPGCGHGWLYEYRQNDRHWLGMYL